MSDEEKRPTEAQMREALDLKQIRRKRNTDAEKHLREILWLDLRTAWATYSANIAALPVIPGPNELRLSPAPNAVIYDVFDHLVLLAQAYKVNNDDIVFSALGALLDRCEIEHGSKLHELFERALDLTEGTGGTGRSWAEQRAELEEWCKKEHGMSFKEYCEKNREEERAKKERAAQETPSNIVQFDGPETPTKN
jgi:hypothetical protein